MCIVYQLLLTISLVYKQVLKIIYNFCIVSIHHFNCSVRKIKIKGVVR